MSYFPKSRECPACASSKISLHFEMRYWQEFALDFYLCADCEARFANPMPSNELIARGNNALVKHYSRERDFSHEFRDARQAYLRGKLLGRQLSSWKSRGRLLEVGSYNGFFLLGIRDASDWQVEGVEIASTLVHFARKKLGLTMHEGVLEECPLQEQSYDFVVFNDLIEHITQPRAFLQKVSAVLKPGGRVQLITPNANQDTAFAKRASDQGTPIFIVLNHIMFFSPRSLRVALERAGLRVREIYGFDISHSLKDYNVFGLGRVGKIDRGPSFAETEGLLARDFSSDWTPERLAELKNHPKVSLWYGWYREKLPRFFTWKVPESIGIGHEIFALAEKPVN